MNFITRRLLAALLKHRKNPAPVSNKPIDTLTYFHDRALYLEYEHELLLIRNMVNDSKHIKQDIKFRCQLRENHRNCIPVAANHYTPANQLYWDVAYEVISNYTLGEILEILMPSVSSCIMLHVHKGQLSLATQSINRLRQYAEITCLDYMVFADGFLFDIAQLKEGLTGAEHHQLYELIQEKYPNLAKKLYSHPAMLAINKALSGAVSNNNAAKRYPLDLKKSNPQFKIPWNMAVVHNISVITPKSATDFLHFFQEFPIAHYETLWLNAHLSQIDLDSFISTFKQAFDSNYFNQEQRATFAKVICFNYQQLFKTPKNVVLFAVQNSNPEFIKQAFLTFSMAQMHHLLFTKDGNDCCLMDFAQAQPEVLGFINSYCSEYKNVSAFTGVGFFSGFEAKKAEGISNETRSNFQTSLQ